MPDSAVLSIFTFKSFNLREEGFFLLQSFNVDSISISTNVIFSFNSAMKQLTAIYLLVAESHPSLNQNLHLDWVVKGENRHRDDCP